MTLLMMANFLVRLRQDTFHHYNIRLAFFTPSDLIVCSVRRVEPQKIVVLWPFCYSSTNLKPLKACLVSDAAVDFDLIRYAQSSNECIFKHKKSEIKANEIIRLNWRFKQHQQTNYRRAKWMLNVKRLQYQNEHSTHKERKLNQCNEIEPDKAMATVNNGGDIQTLYACTNVLLLILVKMVSKILPCRWGMFLSKLLQPDLSFMENRMWFDLTLNLNKSEEI